MSGSASESVRPTALRKEGDEFLVIEWSDGQVSQYAWRDLRAQCPCAGCKEERQKPPEPFHILKANEVGPLKPVSVTPVGHYAYKIVWSDGHDAGIFTIEFLRELAERSQ